MLQIIEQTDEEKIAMYMKMAKIDIVRMLIKCNNIIDEFIETQEFVLMPLDEFQKE